MKKRLLSLALCGALLCGALAGCGGNETPSTSQEPSSGQTEDEPKILTTAVSAELNTLYPLNMDVQNNIGTKLCYEGLVNYENGEVVPCLAESWEFSDDGTALTFHLKEGVTFHDGTPFNAEAVKTDFEFAHPNPNFSNISAVAKVESIEVVDEYTVTFHYPNAYFAYLMDFCYPETMVLVSPAVLEEGNYQSMNGVVGTGPYVYEEIVDGDYVRFVRNENYWGEQPYYDEVIVKYIPDASARLQALQSGEIDILDCDMIDAAIVDATYRTQYADRIVSGHRLATTYLALNENVAPLNDVNVRKAVQMAIDRESILATVYSGDGTIPDGIYPEGLVGYSEANQGWLTYDPEGAKALLAEAGYADGFEMELASDSSADASVLLVLQIIQQNLADVGITAEIVSYDEASWLDERMSGEMCSFVATWTADYNDPDNFIYTFFGNAENTASRSINYYNAEVMDRVTAARAIVDEDERLAEYAALEKQIVETDAAWVPLCSRTHLFVTGDAIASYTPHWAGYSDFMFSGVTLA